MTEQTFQEYCNRIRRLEKRVEAIEQRFNAEKKGNKYNYCSNCDTMYEHYKEDKE